ncbi:uncharacterized protein LOC108031422 [Drosophila biarmipes]|uniref:uncharacterized protein LOC108031422 n=1 Tax=Drosophila biarmipes TaxID=125945 RepID=UPI0007E7BF41|nr:uncharacterized protein LOC108031422 [Drosophila biarmipes]
MFRRNNAHPVIRQFILRTAVLNYLGKDLRQQYDEFCQLKAHFSKSSQVTGEDQEDEVQQVLSQLLEVQRSKMAASHRLLKREYNDLFTYMMDKSELWDSPEYFKAKAALEAANHRLRACGSLKPMD